MHEILWPVLMQNPDINECDGTNGHCHHLCTNIPGSLHCSCEKDFLLLEDGLSCEGKTNCAYTLRHSCNYSALCALPCGPNGKCNANSRQCDCYLGYTGDSCSEGMFL